MLMLLVLMVIIEKDVMVPKVIMGCYNETNNRKILMVVVELTVIMEIVVLMVVMELTIIPS